MHILVFHIYQEQLTKENLSTQKKNMNNNKRETNSKKKRGAKKNFKKMKIFYGQKTYF